LARHKELLDGLIAETGLAQSNPKAAARLYALLESPPNTETLFSATAKAGGVFDRAVWFGSFGTRGATREALNLWGQTAAHIQLHRALEAYAEAKQAEASGMTKKAAHLRHIAGAPVDHPELVQAAGLGNALATAVYHLENPIHFRPMLKKHKELVMDSYAFEQSFARQGLPYHVSFNDMLANSGLLVDDEGEALDKEDARTVIDAMSLQKGADRVRQIVRSVSPEIEGLAAMVAKGNQAALPDLVRAVAQTVQNMMDVTLPMERIPQKWQEYRLETYRQDHPVSATGMLLNEQRQLRAIVSSKGNELAHQALEALRPFIAAGSSNSALSQMDVGRLLAVAEGFANYRADAGRLLLAQDVMLETVMKSLNGGEVRDGARLVSIAQALAQASDATYGAELASQFRQQPEQLQQLTEQALGRLLQSKNINTPDGLADHELEEQQRLARQHEADRTLQFAKEPGHGKAHAVDGAPDHELVGVTAATLSQHEAKGKLTEDVLEELREVMDRPTTKVA
jgi:hypothetical protein